MNFDVDFDRAPLLVIWEATRACALACRHCRGEAEDRRDPRELSTDEGRRLMDQAAAMGTPLFIVTGGDPLQRDDLETLIAHGKSRGLRVATIPATTPRLTAARVRALQAAGLDQMALSLDGHDAASHDAFRGVPGSFDRVLDGARWAREAGLPLQINTVFGGWNADRFDETAALVERLGVVFWEVFFLVPTGRGALLRGCRADEFETLFARLHALARRVDFVVKVTEGQHYRRYLAQQGEAGGDGGGPPARHRGPIGASPRPVNAGNGFCFVDHTGDICPSGFLPLPCGNARRDGLAEVYREAPLFRTLRDPARLRGKCARCEYLAACGGGSRARAYAATGDALASEPECAYEPGKPTPSAHDAR